MFQDVRCPKTGALLCRFDYETREVEVVQRNSGHKITARIRVAGGPMAPVHVSSTLRPIKPSKKNGAATPPAEGEPLPLETQNLPTS